MPKKVRRGGDLGIGNTRRPGRGKALNGAKCRRGRELSRRDDAALRPNRSDIYSDKQSVTADNVFSVVSEVW